MRGHVLLAALLAITLSGCAGDISVESTPSSSPASDGSPASSPATASPGPTAEADRVVELSSSAVADVPLGTEAADAERRLVALLGPPTSSDEELSDCNGDRSGHLAWDGLTVFLISEDARGLVLSGWSARASPGIDYRLPFDTLLGESAAETEGKVPGSSGVLLEEGPYADSYVVTTPGEPGLRWLADGPQAVDLIDEVTFEAPTCD